MRNFAVSSRRSRGSAAAALIALLVGLAIGAAAGMLVGQLAARGGGHGSVAAMQQLAAVQTDGLRLTRYAVDASQGAFDAFDELDLARQQIGRSIASLRHGDPALRIPPADGARNDLLEHVERDWREIDRLAATITLHQPDVLNASDAASDIAGQLPQLQARLDEVMSTLARSGAPAAQIRLLAQQILLAQRLGDGVRRLLQGGDDVISVADRFARDASMLARMLGALTHGDPGLGIEPIADVEARRLLDQATATFAGLADANEMLLNALVGVFEAQGAAQQIILASDDMVDSAQRLAAAYH
jgi:hypothetical protein